MGPSGVSSTNQNLLFPKPSLVFFPSPALQSLSPSKETLQDLQGCQREQKGQIPHPLGMGAGHGLLKSDCGAQAGHAGLGTAGWAWSLGLALLAGFGHWVWHSWLGLALLAGFDTAHWYWHTWDSLGLALLADSSTSGWVWHSWLALAQLTGIGTPG